MALNTKTLAVGVLDILCVDGGITGNKQIVDGDGTASNIYIDGTNLGIGQSSPTYPLHISSAGDYPIVAESTDAGSGIYLKDNTTDAFTGMMTVGNDLQLRTSNTTRIFVADGGNVGIGTSSPLGALDVRGVTRFGGPHYLGKTQVSIASGVLNITSTQGPYIAAIAQQGVGSDDADTIVTITIDGAEPTVGSMIYLSRASNDIITLTCGGAAVSTIRCNYSESDDEDTSEATSVVIASGYEIVQLLYTESNRWAVMNPSAVRVND
mgnify:CR=1 FL=1|tara:strand:+ start:5296 stop:6093 length:798 start_codon:yes stop_codon:yes gene_type:complete